MRKQTLFMACLVGLTLLASCKKDPVAPTISPVADAGYVTENAQIYSGDDIKVGFIATGEKLTKIEITLTGNGTVIDTRNQVLESVASYSYSATFTVEATGTVTITGTVTDANGLTASKSFNITINEKPNKKFVGRYEGNALFTGTMEANVAGQNPMQQEVTDEEIPFILNITEGESMNEVIIVSKVKDQESTVTGNVEGDKISVVLTEVPFTFDYEIYNGFTVSPTIITNLNLTATLAGGQLQLDGTCNGNGEVQAFIYNGTVSIDGTIGGSLDKTE